MVDNYPGSLFIVAAPSGGGKTSLVKNLVESLPNIVVSVSHTTRQMRPGEVDGVHYYFIDEQMFRHQVATGAFLEYAQVYNHYYGTSEAEIMARLQAGIDVVLDIDWQGAAQIRQAFKQAVSIFIIPPSLNTLKKRLMDRQQDDAKTIHDRMQRACDEVSHYSEFDYLIVNDEFEKAAHELQAIVIANRLKMQRQSQQQRQLLTILLSSESLD